MEEPNNTLQLIQPSLNLEICIDADSCARELKRCADEADRCVALTQAAADFAIRHAWNAGQICWKAKSVLPHGEFMPWIEANAGERGYFTLNKWMKLAKFDLNQILDSNPKGLNDAYKLTGISPELVKEQTVAGESDKVKLAWSPIKFSTRIDDWTKDQALDWLYEYDRMSQWARQLRMEFGLT